MLREFLQRRASRKILVRIETDHGIALEINRKKDELSRIKKEVTEARCAIISSMIDQPLRYFNRPVCIETLSCLLYTSPSPRDLSTSRMPSSA